MVGITFFSGRNRTVPTGRGGRGSPWNTRAFRESSSGYRARVRVRVRFCVRRLSLQTPSPHEGAPPLCTLFCFVWCRSRKRISQLLVFFFPPLVSLGRQQLLQAATSRNELSQVLVTSVFRRTSDSSTRATLTLAPLRSVKHTWLYGNCFKCPRRTPLIDYFSTLRWFAAQPRPVLETGNVGTDLSVFEGTVNISSCNMMTKPRPRNVYQPKRPSADSLRTEITAAQRRL